MKKLILLLLAVTSFAISHAQTCTISGSGTIDWSSATCTEGGVTTSSATTIIVPNGVNLNFTTDPNKSATLIVQSGGTVTNDKANANWNGDITINSGGSFVLNQKLDMGTSGGCGYDLILYGTMVLNGSGGSDLLSICGVKIAQSGGGCNDCGGTNSGTCTYNNQPYCEPSGGFSGPLGYSESGYNAALPVTLTYFETEGAEISKDQFVVNLRWATSFEENFERFVIERSIDGKHFEPIGHVNGAGRNLANIMTEYEFQDKSPLVGQSYYRLKAVDIDRSFQYSRLKSVKLGGERIVSVYPNPSAGDEINVMSNFNPSEGDRIVLRNAFGTEIYTGTIVTNKITIVPGGKLNPGFYFIEYKGVNQNMVVKFFINR